MAYVEERFSKVMSMSRKHHVLPEELYKHHQDLLQQVDEAAQVALMKSWKN